MLTYCFGERKSVFLVGHLNAIWDTASTLADARNDLNQIFQVTFWQKVWARIYVPLIARHVFHGTQRKILLLLLIQKSEEKYQPFWIPLFVHCALALSTFQNKSFSSIEMHPLCNAFLPGGLVQAINSHHQISSSRDFSLRCLGTHSAALCKEICK